VDGSANGGFTNIQTNAESGTNAGGLNAVAVAGGVVLGVSVVAANGTYSIGGIVANTANLTILLTTANPGIGQAAPTPNVPVGWTNTSPLVTAAFSAGTINISGRNFGIEQPPTATGGTAPTLPNPSGAQFSPVPSGIFTGTDPDGVVLIFTLTAFPSNATAITVNAVNYTSANFPATGLAINAVSDAFPANLLTVDPVDGVVTVQFTFMVSDNAGKSSTQATANVPFGAALPPNLQLTKNCVVPADCETQPQLPATDLTYRISFTNAGGQAAQGLIILDKIPANTDFKIGSATVNAPAGLLLMVEYSYDYNPATPAAATWTSAAPASGGGGANAGYNRLVKAIRWRATSGLLNNVAPDNLGQVAFIVKII
jgi:uncharacterized repeat protein (TIGR01451 family)